MTSSIETSQLLNEEETKKFMSIVEMKSKILYFTVARLYQALNNEWHHIHTGLITITKDNGRKKYYFEIYDMDKEIKCWEQVIPVNFIYNVFKKQIHTFTSNDTPSLLSFASNDESIRFAEEFKKLDNKRSQQKMNSHRRSELTIGSQYSSVKEVTIPVKPQNTLQNKKTKFSKSDISNPTNFKHIDHMGLHDHFFENPEDENLKAFLKKNNMEKLLDNDESKRDIYELIEKGGGFQKLDIEIKQQQQQQQMRKAPPVPQKNPPPPPDRNPPSAQISKHVSAVPPPPPPLGSLVPPPPPAPPTIQIPMKPVTQSSVPPAPSGKGGFLQEIEKFDAKKLKARPEGDEVCAPPPPTVGGSLLDSLAQYLVQRKTLLTGTSNSDESDNNSDDDWE